MYVAMCASHGRDQLPLSSVQMTAFNTVVKSTGPSLFKSEKSESWWAHWSSVWFGTEVSPRAHVLKGRSAQKWEGIRSGRFWPHLWIPPLMDT